MLEVAPNREGLYTQMSVSLDEGFTEERTMWLVFDIGCLDCSEESQVLGIYVTEEEAETANQEYITYKANQSGPNLRRPKG